MLAKVFARYARMKNLLIPALLPLMFALTACSGTVTYEFPSCVNYDDSGWTRKEPNKPLVLNVMEVPKGYQSNQGQNILISDKEPYHWTEEIGVVNKNDGVFRVDKTLRNTGFNWAVLYGTYPDYLPLGDKSWRDTKENTASKERGELVYQFGTLEYHRNLTHRIPPMADFSDTEQERKEKHFTYRVREESKDGKFWVYPFPRNNQLPLGYSDAKEWIYFVPKGEEKTTVITCKNDGNDSWRKDFHCFVNSNFNKDTPHLSCRSLTYRIHPNDIYNWRDIDVKAKKAFATLITHQRTHGYVKPSTQPSIPAIQTDATTK
jgi:hypothetical protein